MVTAAVVDSGLCRPFIEGRSKCSRSVFLPFVSPVACGCVLCDGIVSHEPMRSDRGRVDFKSGLKVCEEIIGPDLPCCHKQVGRFAGVKR